MSVLALSFAAGQVRAVRLGFAFPLPTYLPAPEPRLAGRRES